MNPIKVKAYGLINFTRKQYSIIQTIVFGMLILVFVLSFLYDFDKFMFGNAKVFIVVIAFLESIETLFMFKKFKEKEENKMNKEENIQKKSIIHRITKTIIITFAILFVVALSFLFVIPNILNIVAGKDIKMFDDSNMQLEVVSLPDEENSFFELQKIREVIVIDNIPKSINLRKDFLESDKWESELVSGLLSKNESAFELFDKAAEKGKYQSPITADYNNISPDMEVISMSHYREIARLSAIKAIWLAKNGKQKEAFDETFKMITIGDAVERSQCNLITYLVGISIKGTGVDTYNKVLALSSSDLINKSVYRKKLSEYNMSNNVSQFKTEYLMHKRAVSDIASGAKDISEEYSLTPLNNFYFKPNLTISYSYDYFNDLINDFKNSCDVKTEVYPKGSIEIDSIMDLPKLYFTENAIGKLVYSVGSVALSSVKDKKCEFQEKIDKIVNEN